MCMSNLPVSSAVLSNSILIEDPSPIVYVKSGIDNVLQLLYIRASATAALDLGKTYFPSIKYFSNSFFALSLLIKYQAADQSLTSLMCKVGLIL